MCVGGGEVPNRGMLPSVRPSACPSSLGSHHPLDVLEHTLAVPPLMDAQEALLAEELHQEVEKAEGVKV